MKIGGIVWPYGACILRAPRGPQDAAPDLCGSATFVRRGKTYYLLTVAHVWREVQKSSEFSLVFARGSHKFKRLVSHYLTQLPVAESEEWGPDSVLVRIPDADVGTIEAYCAYYDLRHASPGAGLTEFDFFAVVGVPAETSGPREFRRTCFFCARPSPISRNGRIYFDVDVLSSDRFRLPSSFGGVSGGSLWGISLADASDLHIAVVRDAVLLGVAYYQLFPHTIRCQGMESGIDQSSF